jgi:hypothetical protein
MLKQLRVVVAGTGTPASSAARLVVHQKTCQRFVIAAR